MGEQPVIFPKTGFEYSSACPLNTPNGRMVRWYRFLFLHNFFTTHASMFLKKTGTGQLLPTQEILMILWSLELIPKTWHLILDSVVLSCLLQLDVYALRHIWQVKLDLNKCSELQEGDFEMKHIDKVGSSTFNIAIAPFSLSILGDDNDAPLWRWLSSRPSLKKTAMPARVCTNTQIRVMLLAKYLEHGT